MVRAKLEQKNNMITERDSLVKELEARVKQLETQLADAARQMEGREGLIDAIGAILNEDNVP